MPRTAQLPPEKESISGGLMGLLDNGVPAGYRVRGGSFLIRERSGGGCMKSVYYLVGKVKDGILMSIIITVRVVTVENVIGNEDIR